MKHFDQSMVSLKIKRVYVSSENFELLETLSNKAKSIGILLDGKEVYNEEKEFQTNLASVTDHLEIGRIQ